MPFALDSNPSASEISEAINYILANFGGGNTVDPVTGQIIAPGGTFVGYIYQYIAVKYADSPDGSVNFSNSPVGRSYFGLRNSNSASESTNPADYIWYQASGGFGLTKSLWYIATGGRQIQFAVSVTAPDSGWVVDPGSSIDLDIVTSNTAPVIAEAFVTFFSPPTLQVPRSGSPLTPSFTGIVPRLYATDKGAIVPFTDAQTDIDLSFVNGSWRIGNSPTTGYGDISYSNLTIGNPTDGGDYAQWPNPTAMPNSPAYITVPVRYKNSSGIVSQASVATCQLLYGDPGPTGSAGPTVDISGYVSFVQNTGGAFTPSNTALSALIENITSPTYSWSISGATPTSSTSSTVVVTPTSTSTGVTVTLTVNGSNLASPLSKTISMPVVYDGATGAAGANGIMSAFPTIYIWTGSSSVPTRPTTTSTYTWSSGSYTAPSGWYTEAPSNTTAGNYLWAITIPLNVSATTTTSTLDWTNTSYPIRAIAYNGANGAAGTPGTNGTNGSATFVVVRTANDSSPPTNAEVTAVIGRNPVAGDIVTVSYNNSNNAVVYRYTTSWITQATYITGSLIVDGTITANKLVSNFVYTQKLEVGNTPALATNGMTGSGLLVNTDGSFALGNSNRSITFDGVNNPKLNGFLNGSTNTGSTTLYATAIAGGTGSFSSGSFVATNAIALIIMVCEVQAYTGAGAGVWAANQGIKMRVTLNVTPNGSSTPLTSVLVFGGNAITGISGWIPALPFDPGALASGLKYMGWAKNTDGVYISNLTVGATYNITADWVASTINMPAGAAGAQINTKCIVYQPNL